MSKKKNASEQKKKEKTQSTILTKDGKGPSKKIKKKRKVKKMKRKVYEKELARLQVELVKLQEWVKYKGLKVVVVFEGRDTAGKGGTIKRIIDR
ncbi:MAG: hypothetical protein PVG32_15825, partial [Anaerolineales bacterium]